MCIHYFNVHTCGHRTYNFDLSANSHCTKVQKQLFAYHDQPYSGQLNPGQFEWPVKPPQVCPVSQPTHHRLAPSRQWWTLAPEGSIRGWSAYKDGPLDNFFRNRGELHRHARLRTLARSSGHPTRGDGRDNVQLIEVPWGCGRDSVRCSSGLAGRRCPEKESQRAKDITARLRINGLSMEEVSIALAEENRIRHLEDVRCLELGFDPATPIFRDLRMEQRSISWWWQIPNGVAIDRKPRSQLWGGASVIGVLDPDPDLEPESSPPAPPAPQKESQQGRGRKRRHNRQPASRAQSMITNPCHDESHQRYPSGVNRPNSQPEADSGYSSIDQRNPFWGTLHDTDDETVQVYGRAWPLHSERGRPIIDGSLEYWEAMQQRPRAPRGRPVAGSEVLCPTIVTRSGRLILEGSADSIEVVEDGVVEEMVRVESEEGMSTRQGEEEEADRQGLDRGQMDVSDDDKDGNEVVDGVLEDCERP